MDYETSNSAAQVDEVLGLQRAAGYRVPPARERVDALRRLEEAIRENTDALADAISADFGNRARPETIMADLAPTLAAIAHARKNLGKWMRQERRAVPLTFQPGSAWVQYQPLGCVGVIAPWNYPLFLTAVPLANALAAGNRVVVKPSESTPNFSDVFAAMIERAFKRTDVAVITGGPDVSRAMAAAGFDHILFTGSTARGRDVARACAETLTPVTLELGGKSPTIVAPGYDVVAAARSLAAGKFFNAGQTCVAPDYALVPAGSERAFADALIARVREMYPVIAANPDATCIINDTHRARLRDLITEAEQLGATALRHGAGDADGRMEPVVLLNVPEQARVLREEIFGPILPVIGYKTLDDAIAYVNAREHPLALYVYSDNRFTAIRVMERTLSGGVTLNGTLLHTGIDDLPFGGVRQSGIGAYHGREGFLRFSHARGVYAPGVLHGLMQMTSGFEMLTPPYGKLTRMAERFMMR